MKKMGWFLLVMLFAMLIAACGDSDTTNEKESNNASEQNTNSEANNEGSATEEKPTLSGEITVWAHPYTDGLGGEGDMWKEIMANFEAETGVKVNFEQIPWANRDQKILTALSAKQGPDVFYVIPDQMPQYAEEGMLLDLSSYLSAEDLSGFVPSSLEATKWKGKQYGLPILQTAESLIYNVEIVKAIGEDPSKLPTTWDEFKVWAQKAVDAGYYAFSYAGGGSLNNTLYPFLWQAGGNVINENNEIMINNEAGIKTFELINEMYTKGWIPQDSITALEHESLYYGGKLMAANGSGASISTLLAEKPFEFVIAPPLKETAQATYGTVGMFVGSGLSNNPDAAAAFIKYMTNADNQRKFNEITQYIPTQEAAKDIFATQPYMAQLADYTQYAKPGIIHPQGRNIMPLIQAELQAMLEGKQSAEEAANKAAAAIEKLLK